MSRVHDAVRRLEHRPDVSPGASRRSLVCGLIEELADQVPDDPRLDIVKSDLLAASHSCESVADHELPLRFYLAIRSLLREHAVLRERLRKVESDWARRGPEPGHLETSSVAAQPAASQYANHREPSSTNADDSKVMDAREYREGASG
jgi:hypothetical protein